MSRYFPLFIDLEGKKIAVVGAGKIASRRIRTLLEFGAELTVLAPEASEEVRCLAGREPEQRSTKFSRPIIQKPQIKVGKDHVSIVLCHADYYSYMIKRDGKIIYEGKYLPEISDCPDKGSHAYTVIPYYSDGHKKYFGDAVNLERIFFGGDDGGSDRRLPPPITGKDWYN